MKMLRRNFLKIFFSSLPILFLIKAILKGVLLGKLVIIGIRHVESFSTIKIKTSYGDFTGYNRNHYIC